MKSMDSFVVTKPKLTGELQQADSFTLKPEFDETLLSNVEAESADIAKVSIIDSRVEKCNLSAAKVTESLWQRVEVVDSRMSGIDWYDSILKDVVFVNCKLDLANFRATKFKNVIFKECVLVAADLQGAQLTNVIFESCEINEMDANGCKLNNVDLRSSTFTVIKGTSALKGAIMSRQQLIMLAPVFANEVGIKIED